METDNKNESDSNSNSSSDQDGSSNSDISISQLIDISLNVSSVNDVSQNNYFFAYDPSYSHIDIPSNTNNIIDLSSIIVIDGSGYTIITESGNSLDGSYVTNTKFLTTDPSFNLQITENLTETISTYNDDSNPNNENYAIIKQIELYASQINCSDFHGKGTIDDYTELFKAASKIANETKQMELNVDVEGFSEFANAADDLSNLFNGFIIKLKNINIISDVTFLNAIANALSKIVNLSKIFKTFKETVFATSSIQIPKSTHDTAIILQGVIYEINCAVEHIQYFVDPTDISLNDAKLSTNEKNMISKSVETINTWNALCENRITIAMDNEIDIKYIKETSDLLKTKTITIRNAASNLRSKLSNLNIIY